MSFYIESNTGGFISGLYASEAEAQAAIKRFIVQSAKRLPTDQERRAVVARLSQSLRVVRNADSTPPAYLIDELGAEIYMRIAGDAVGTIYTRPLLLDMARTRIMGKKGDYFEIGPIQRQQALSKLIDNNTGPLFEDVKTGTISRTKHHYSLAGTGRDGLYKSYIQRI